MKLWLIYGIIAALFWGSYIIAAKVASSEKYFNVSSRYMSLFMLIGIAVVFLGIFFFSEKPAVLPSRMGMGFGILAGMIWALGMFFALKAITAGADVARLTPIYNTNTLIAVLLGIILLHELPTAGQAIKVIIGALLIVVGSVLVSF